MAGMKFELVKLRRYPMYVVSNMAAMFLVLTALLFSAQVIAGVDDVGLVGKSSTATIVIGYIMWFYAMIAIQKMGADIEYEAQIGTLEQLYINSLSFLMLLPTRVLCAMVVGLVRLVPALFLMMAMTGNYIDLQLDKTMPIILITCIGLCGFGYILAGLALLFKQLGHILAVFQFGLAALAITPLEKLSSPLQIVAFTLPLAQGARMLRMIMIENSSLLELARRGDILLLAINSMVYLIVGMTFYTWAEKVAKEHGLIGYY